MSEAGLSHSGSSQRLAARDPAAAAAAAAAAAVALPGGGGSSAGGSSRSVNGGSTPATPAPADSTPLLKGRLIYANVPRGQASAISFIKYASLDKLIEKLTDEKEQDFVFKEAFVLCYKSFCTPTQFAQGLVERYQGVTGTEIGRNTGRVAEAAASRTNVTQLKVLSAFSHWLKKEFARKDVLADPESKEIIHKFMLSIVESSSSHPGAKNIASTILDLVSQWESDRSNSGLDADRRSGELDIAGLDISDARSVSSSNSYGSPPNTEIMNSNDVVLDASGFVTNSSDPMAENLEDSPNDGPKNGTSPPMSTSSSASPGTQELSVSSVGSSLMDNYSTPVDFGSPETLAARARMSSEGNGTSSVLSDAPSLSSLASLQDPNAANGQKKHRASSRSSSTKDKPSKSSHRLKPLLGLPPDQVAQQLTHMEMESFYLKLQPREFTNKAWTRETRKKDARHIVRAIDTFNARTNWVASEILHPKLETTDRAKVISFFIDVAEVCRRLNNFNTLFEIVNGLKNPCLAQLHNTWTLVHQSRLERFSVLQQIITAENNYAQYRNAVSLCEGQPYLPCLVVIVRDLFALEEGMPTFEHGLIHFAKFRKIYETVAAFLKSQQQPYPVASKGDGSRHKSGDSKVIYADEKLQKLLKMRMKYFQKSQVDLWRLAKHANTQESITFVNSIQEAGFL